MANEWQDIFNDIIDELELDVKEKFEEHSSDAYALYVLGTAMLKIVMLVQDLEYELDNLKASIRH